MRLPIHKCCVKPSLLCQCSCTLKWVWKRGKTWGCLAALWSSWNISRTDFCLSTLVFFLGTRLYVPILLFFLRADSPPWHEPTAQERTMHILKRKETLYSSFLQKLVAFKPQARKTKTKCHLEKVWLWEEEEEEAGLQEALVRLMEEFVLKLLACVLESEVDGSQEATGASTSPGRCSWFSPAWRFWPLVVPCWATAVTRGNNDTVDTGT